MVKQFFLISTSHLLDKIWFQDDEDFKVGMNLVAVAAFVCKVTILDFILMSNHVHFVVQASLDVARRFIDYYKLLYSKYLRERYGASKTLRGNSADLRPLEDTEALCSAIAYVQMNCVAAGICVNPSQYPWGCGGLFFNPAANGARNVGSLSLRAQRRLLHSKVLLPPDYLLSSRDCISPESYVPVGFVERLFRTPGRLQFFLNRSSKARNRLSNDSTPSFRDQVILSGISDLCYSLFRKSSLSELSGEEKAEMLKQLRYRFSADIAQLSRVTGISYPEACSLIEAF